MRPLQIYSDNITLASAVKTVEFIGNPSLLEPSPICVAVCIRRRTISNGYDMNCPDSPANAPHAKLANPPRLGSYSPYHQTIVISTFMS